MHKTDIEQYVVRNFFSCRNDKKTEFTFTAQKKFKDFFTDSSWYRITKWFFLFKTLFSVLISF